MDAKAAAATAATDDDAAATAAAAAAAAASDAESLLTPTTSLSPAMTLPDDDEPPPYSPLNLDHHHQTAPQQQWTAQDPRSSSTHSLGRDLTPEDSRRKLLLVYLHGFMGNETSFQSFPAHVHNLVSVIVSDTHAVHTKIYPRYRSRHAISVAANDLSSWLAPHESPNTDVVLLGHSMGGLVAAELALLPPISPSRSTSGLRHRLLGTINFDVPFLGMHPGVITSGLGSLFRPAPTPPPPPHAPHSDSRPSLTPQSSSSSSSTPMLSPTASLAGSLYDPQPQDPNYNPSFYNDVRLPVRTGWRNAAHFLQKHSSNLQQATKQLVSSHVEFGSCMADYNGLKVRYSRIRMLEEENARSRATVVSNSASPPRVRFLNYYTASTGYPKKPKPLKENEAALPEGGAAALPHIPIDEQSVADTEHSSQPPGYSDLEDMSDTSSCGLSDLAELDPIETIVDSNSDASSATLVQSVSEEPDMPQAPGPPPERPELETFATRIDYARALKSYHGNVRTYHAQIRAYHHALMEYRKRAVVKASQLPALSPSPSRASTEDRAEPSSKGKGRLGDYKALREQRKQEYELRREDIKNQIAAVRKQAKGDYAMRKEQRKELKHILKEERKTGIHLLKQELKHGDAEGKADKKLQKYLQKEAEKRGKAEAKVAKKEHKSDVSLAPESLLWEATSQQSSQGGRASASSEAGESSSRQPSTTSRDGPPLPPRANEKGPQKPLKDRKFCMLPPEDSSGQRDPTWVRIYMAGVDEVGAHCGLFFPKGAHGQEAGGEGDESAWGERYALLVGDVAGRIEQWVQDAMTERLVRGVGAM